MPGTICVTGGIGSGKSTICRVFEVWGVPVFRADEEARLAYNDPTIRKAVVELVGQDVFDGVHLDRKLLASRVFSNPDKLNQLNALIHPWVGERWKSWKLAQHTPYVIREAAILFEAGRADDCDKIVLVSAPEKLRIERVVKRDGVHEEEVRKRMTNQWDDARRRPFVHREWVNDNSNLLLPTLYEAHQQWSVRFAEMEM